MALGVIEDVDDFVDANVSTIEQYTESFEALKGARRDLDRLVPNEETVGCYQINLGPVKMAAEEHMQHVRDALVSSLRRRAQSEKDEVSFIGLYA